VKILFDANTPAPLARFLRGHEVVRADELGWQGLGNGALLDAAEQAGFDLLLTCDQNVRYQQNFASRKLALVILSSNHWPTLRRIAARIATAVDFVQTGQIVTVDVATL
jgi:predicted nuclease of predicted toxin-antitoxin system